MKTTHPKKRSSSSCIANKLNIQQIMVLKVAKRLMNHMDLNSIIIKNITPNDQILDTIECMR